MTASADKIHLLQKLSRFSEAELAGALEALTARGCDDDDLLELQPQHRALIGLLRRSAPKPVSMPALQLALGDARGSTSSDVVRQRVAQLCADHRPHVRAMGEAIVVVRSLGYRWRGPTVTRYAATAPVSAEVFDDPTY